MRYVLLIYSNDESWAALSEEDRRELGRGHATLRNELIASGQMAGGQGLSDEALSKTVRVRKSVVSATDGPYVESKEHLAGFYIVDCLDIDQAVAIAARIPDAQVNAVEVRPVVDNSAYFD